MSSVDFQVTLDGPLFAVDVQTTVQNALNGAVRAIAEKGYDRITSAFPEGLPVKTGALQGAVRVAVYGPAAVLDGGAMVYGPWIEGVSSRNESSRFKGYSTWRRTLAYLKDEIVPDVTANAGDQLAKELGG